jgi:hypothetical protein
VLVPPEQIGHRRCHELDHGRIEHHGTFGGERHHRGGHEWLRARRNAIGVLGGERLTRCSVGEAAHHLDALTIRPEQRHRGRWQRGVLGEHPLDDGREAVGCKGEVEGSHGTIQAGRPDDRQRA